MFESAIFEGVKETSKETQFENQDLPPFSKEMKPTKVKDFDEANKPLIPNEVTEGQEDKRTDLDELGLRYTNQLKGLSPYPETIENQDLSDWEKCSPEEVAEKRAEFRNLKDDLIKEWESNHGREWPTYEEDVYSENGKLIRKAGDKYDAHHIQPLEYGGKNSVDNINPMHAKDHYDRQGIHAPDGILNNEIKKAIDRGEE
jgi:hypothetical protein